MEMKTEIEVKHIQVKESQRLPVAHQKLGERHETFFFTSLRRKLPCQELDFKLFYLQE